MFSPHEGMDLAKIWISKMVYSWDIIKQSLKLGCDITRVLHLQINYCHSNLPDHQ